MGIKKGITLIIGGGYHGKSTLLKALELGVYNHIKGDGREYVITDDTAMKIRAEDGRCIHNTDISLFINNLPGGRDTRSFYTEDASGSTSQAANVVEAIEAGTSLLLIDEDTCATNFMIRDELMQRVVHRDQEPITPFIERVRPIYEDCGISSVIVAGSSGSYFHIADQIIQMDCYVPADITDLAKKEAQNFPLESQPLPMPALPDFDRRPAGGLLKAQDRIKMKTLGKDAFSSTGIRWICAMWNSWQTANRPLLFPTVCGTPFLPSAMEGRIFAPWLPPWKNRFWKRAWNPWAAAQNPTPIWPFPVPRKSSPVSTASAA